jgi:hypothetical protein
LAQVRKEGRPALSVRLHGGGGGLEANAQRGGGAQGGAGVQGPPLMMVIGGFDGAVLPNVEVYDGPTRRWRQAPPLLQARAGAASLWRPWFD